MQQFHIHTYIGRCFPNLVDVMFIVVHALQVVQVAELVAEPVFSDEDVRLVVFLAGPVQGCPQSPSPVGVNNVHLSMFRPPRSDFEPAGAGCVPGGVLIRADVLVCVKADVGQVAELRVDHVRGVKVDAEEV